jgi:hypothetical protein
MCVYVCVFVRRQKQIQQLTVWSKTLLNNKYFISQWRYFPHYVRPIYLPYFGPRNLVQSLKSKFSRMRVNVILHLIYRLKSGLSFSDLSTTTL